MGDAELDLAEVAAAEGLVEVELSDAQMRTLSHCVRHRRLCSAPPLLSSCLRRNALAGGRYAKGRLRHGRDGQIKISFGVKS